MAALCIGTSTALIVGRPSRTPARSPVTLRSGAARAPVLSQSRLQVGRVESSSFRVRCLDNTSTEEMNISAEGQQPVAPETPPAGNFGAEERQSRLKIGGHRGDNDNQPGDGATAGVEVFLGNLAFTVTEDMLAEVLKDFNPIQIRLIIDRWTGRSRGFAFTSFADEETANQVIEHVHGKDLEGRTLRAEIKGQAGNTGTRGPVSRPDDSDRRLYIGNLAWELEDADLYDLCSSYGTVERVRVITNPDTGMSRGFGFVTMSSPEEAQEVVNQCHDLLVNNRYIRVNLADSVRQGGAPGGAQQMGGQQGGGMPQQF